MKDEKMVTISIKDSLYKNISNIAKKEGTNEETIINDILIEAIEEYDNCELLEKVKQAEYEFKEGKTIKLDVDGFNKRYGT